MAHVDRVKSHTLPARRLLVRFGLLFAVVQLVVAVGVFLAVPSLRTQGWESVMLVVLGVVDLALLAVFSGWIIRESVDAGMERLAADVHRIADGDYHHRVGDSSRPELTAIRDSVNRLADRLIADQKRLADNIQSLEETNRELVAIRDQMVQSARLASVGTLAAGIAHEVGNPLGAIIGYVDVAAGRARREGRDTELLAAIRHEAGRIDRIVRGLLDYARAPQAEARPAPVARVLFDVRELLGNQGKLEGVELDWDVDSDAPERVAEPHRLEQVLVNLLLNALDAMEGRPTRRIGIRLRLEEGELARLRPRREEDPPGVNYMHRRRMSDDEGGIDPVSRAASVAVIEITDSGPGIPPEALDRVFDPFFTTKEPGKGTGLGLSICARLVEGMGGQIEASAADGGGARFVVRIPGIDDPDSATVVSSGAEALEAH